MAISQWSDHIMVADLQDEPALSDDINVLLDHVHTAEQPVDLVLNFRGVSYVNSSNLAQLLRLRKEARRQESSLRLCSVNENIWSVMLVSGLDRIFTFETDTASALAAIQLGDLFGEGTSETGTETETETDDVSPEAPADVEHPDAGRPAR